MEKSTQSEGEADRSAPSCSHAPTLAEPNDFGIVRHSGDLTTDQAVTLIRKLFEDHGEAIGKELREMLSENR